MAVRQFLGCEAADLLRDQIRQHSAGIHTTLSSFEAQSAVLAWLEAIRGVEELINLPMQIDEENLRDDLLNLSLDHLSPAVESSLQLSLSGLFEGGVIRRFIKTVVRSAALGLTLRLNGIPCDQLRTLGGAIDFFQARRRHMVALLYLMPESCRGKDSIEPTDSLNVFLPVIEHSCIALTSLYRHMLLLSVHEDFSLAVSNQSIKANYSFDMLEAACLEPERVGITDMPHDGFDLTIMKYRMKVDTRRVFSVPELCNDLLAMEATYAEFKLSETPFSVMASFIAACSISAQDQYHIEFDEQTLRSLMTQCGLSSEAKRRLVFAGTGYANAINSFAPFVHVGRRYVTTVTLLSRFAYNWKTFCLNRSKRFQIRSGFIFEKQVETALANQGFTTTNVKRIEGKEFDVIAIKDDVIYNVQCKNNLVDLTRMEEDPDLFARYNRRLNNYYEGALRKEVGREWLLKQRFGLAEVRHVVLSRFPVATRNRLVMSFREIEQFGKRYAQ